MLVKQYCNTINCQTFKTLVYNLGMAGSVTNLQMCNSLAKIIFKKFMYHSKIHS